MSGFRAANRSLFYLNLRFPNPNTPVYLNTKKIYDRNSEVQDENSDRDKDSILHSTIYYSTTLSITGQIINELDVYIYLEGTYVVFTSTRILKHQLHLNNRNYRKQRP